MASGVFEFRIIGSAHMTGMRETLVVSRILASVDRSDFDGDIQELVSDRVSQRDFDDPGLDTQFPDHPLSIVRQALRWLREEAEIVVTAPAPPVTTGEVQLTGLDAALAPPPRYLLHEQSHGRAQFSRVSLATTDGLARCRALPRATRRRVCAAGRAGRATRAGARAMDDLGDSRPARATPPARTP